MKVIAFDLGSNMAMAHNLSPLKLVVVSQTFSGIREQRAADTLEWLNAWFRVLPLADAVIYERPFARGQHATRSLWGLAGLIEASATKAGYPVLDIDPQTIKRFATGKGSASKEEMIAAAQAAGYQGDNEHEADAHCLVRYAQQHLRSKGVTK